jgi:putative aldouronate transport system permease protein
MKDSSNVEQNKISGYRMNSSRRLTLKKMNSYKMLYLFLLPAIAVCAIFCYYPMFGIIMAFEKYTVGKGFFHSPFVGFANFKHFLTDRYFFIALKNTLAINGFSILFGYPLPIILSLLLFSMRPTPFKRISQTVSYMPHFLSWVIVASLVYRLLEKNNGLFNLLIAAIGMEKVSFMTAPQYFWSVAITVGIWKELGFLTIMYLAALASIPAEQYEAASIDGASGFQKLKHVTLPGISTTMALVLIFTLGTLVNTNGYFVIVPFDAIYNLRNPLLSDTANTIDFMIYQEGVLDIKYSYSSAIGITQSVLAFLMVYFGNKLSKRISGYGAF